MATQTPRSAVQGVLTSDTPARRKLVRGMIFVFIALALFTFSFRIEALSYQNYLRDQKLDNTIKLIQVKERIETEVFSLMLDLNSISTVIGQNPDINPTEFNIKAVDFVLANPDIKMVIAAPDLVSTMVFPRYGNDDAVGIDFRDDPDLFEAIEEIMGTGEGMISGPVKQPDGSLGLILRKPVIQQNEIGANEPWGLVSVVLDYASFMENLGISAMDQEYDVLIAQAGVQDGEVRETLVGDAGLLDLDPVVLDLTFPFGAWQLAVTPDGGWPGQRPGFIGRWLLRTALIAFSILCLWYVMRLSDRGRAAERQLSVGIEALDHGFVMFDSDRRLVAFNRKYKQLAGGSGMVRIGSRYEDIVKANLELGLIPDAVGREKEWYDNWSKRLKTKSSDNEQVLADGRLIRAYDRPMEDGSVVGLRIDITDLKKAQMAAEAANKAKTDFMGVLSHELRTPLTVILGHARLAKNFRSMPAYKKMSDAFGKYPEVRDEISPELDKIHNQIAKMMEALERSGNHLFFLISEILDFAKIDSGTLVMDMEEITTEEILGPVVDQMRPMVEEKGLNFQIEKAPGTLTGDCKRLQQVLINLIGNATKFTETGTIGVKVEADGDHFKFSVSDTGIGIPDEHISKVFEAFHQVDSTSGRKFGGTGLGLAISQDIARAHEGVLTLNSKVGEGSKFTMRIPREQKNVAEPEETGEATDETSSASGDVPQSMVA